MIWAWNVQFITNLSRSWVIFHKAPKVQYTIKWMGGLGKEHNQHSFRMSCGKAERMSKNEKKSKREAHDMKVNKLGNLVDIRPKKWKFPYSQTDVPVSYHNYHKYQTGLRFCSQLQWGFKHKGRSPTAIDLHVHAHSPEQINSMKTISKQFSLDFHLKRKTI